MATEAADESADADDEDRPAVAAGRRRGEGPTGAAVESGPGAAAGSSGSRCSGSAAAAASASSLARARASWASAFAAEASRIAAEASSLFPPGRFALVTEADWLDISTNPSICCTGRSSGSISSAVRKCASALSSSLSRKASWPSCICTATRAATESSPSSTAPPPSAAAAICDSANARPSSRSVFPGSSRSACPNRPAAAS